MHGHVVCCANGSGKLGGNDGLDSIRMLGHAVGFLVCGQNIVKQQSTHLVAGNGLKGAVCGSGHDAHAVCVGVGCHDQVAAYAVSDLDTQLKYLRIFGVGLGNGGEVAVNDHLLGNGVEVLKPNALHDLGNELMTRAVQRGIYDGKIIGNSLDCIGIDRLRNYLCQILFIGLLAQHDNQAVCNSLVKVCKLDVLKNVQRLHGCADGISVLGGQLCAVLPVSLVAVVLLGVVRCGNVNARYAAVFAQSEGKLGSGTQIVKEIGLDAGGCKHLRRGLCKERGIVTAVVGNGNAVGSSAFLDDEVSKTLRCVSNRVYVHSVHAGLHNAAQARGAERKVRGKAQSDLAVVVTNSSKLCLLGIAELIALQPAQVVFHVLFHDRVLLYIYVI